MSRPVVVILRALGLGDLLTAVPALRALADAFPRHERVLATPAALAPLAMCTGAVSRVLDARPLEPLAWSGPAPSVAVNLHGCGPQSHRVLEALSPERMIAFPLATEGQRASFTRYKFHEHEVERWCRLLRGHGIFADASRIEIDLGAACRLSSTDLRLLEAAAGATVLHPGAASRARRWPAERWAAVARALVREGDRVAITGSTNEVELARQVARGADIDESAVLAGRTNVMDLAAVVGAARRVVCGDTGVAHLATALRTPSVVLFGPTPPALWGPPPDRPWHRALWAGMTGDPHADEPHSGLLHLHVDDVLGALASLPSAPPRREAA